MSKQVFMFMNQNYLEIAETWELLIKCPGRLNSGNIFLMCYLKIPFSGLQRISSSYLFLSEEPQEEFLQFKIDSFVEDSLNGIACLSPSKHTGSGDILLSAEMFFQLHILQPLAKKVSRGLTLEVFHSHPSMCS